MLRQNSRITSRTFSIKLTFLPLFQFLYSILSPNSHTTSKSFNFLFLDSNPTPFYCQIQASHREPLISSLISIPCFRSHPSDVSDRQCIGTQWLICILDTSHSGGVCGPLQGLPWRCPRPFRELFRYQWHQHGLCGNGYGPSGEMVAIVKGLE